MSTFNLLRARAFGALVLAFAGIASAWALSAEDTRHLLDRTGFGARPDTAEDFAPLDRAAAVERVLRASAPLLPLPDWGQSPALPKPGRFKGLSKEERLEARRAENKVRRGRQRELKAWVYRQMIASDVPLFERMTLFWHNHFTSQQRIVRSPQLMLRQHLLMRQHALGNFADLLRAVATDPAMLFYLDGWRNHKKRPNENFARELLELFTLGEGHYREADVKAAARALTGWTVYRGSGTARFRPQRHDDGEKTFLGATGNWGLEGILAILLDNPRTAELVVEKLWLEFISPRPQAAEVKRLAGVFRDGGYEIRPLLRVLFLNDAFWADANRGVLIKSPVELIVGTIRRFDLPAPDERRLHRLGRQMGQNLLDPPDVKGWPGYTAWIDTDRLLARERFLRGVMRDLSEETDEAGRTWSALNSEAATRLLWSAPVAGDLPLDTKPMDDTGAATALVEIILDPRYQLK